MRSDRGKRSWARAIVVTLALFTSSCNPGGSASNAAPAPAPGSNAFVVTNGAGNSGGCTVSIQLIQVQSGGNCPPGSAVSASAAPGTSASCLPSSVKQGTPTTVTAHITGYGRPDNSPPGAVIAQPIVHQTAGGDGSYCNPITFATETANDATYPFGTLLYVPTLQRYFIREDTCAGCTGVWFDLWVGGSASDNTTSVLNCEGSITADGVQVIVNPPSTEPVKSPTSPIFNNGTCAP